MVTYLDDAFFTILDVDIDTIFRHHQESREQKVDVDELNNDESAYRTS